MSTGYHEQGLSDACKDAHRAFASLQEELEAADWYNQRVDVTPDEDLKAILAHNRNEELEHASMLLEYLRRQMPELGEHLQTYLFTSLPITEIEEAAEAAEEDGDDNDADGAKNGGLGLGNLS
jgi:hypothetical protein